MGASNLVQVFFDTEYTREGQNTTLISIGLVTEHHSLYIEFNDYDERQTDQWLRKNVLNKLEGKDQVSSDEGINMLQKMTLLSVCESTTGIGPVGSASLSQ